MPILMRDSISARSLAIEPAAGAELCLRLSLPGPPQALPLHWLRPLLCCDALLRVLRAQGLHVRYVRGVPDLAAPTADRAALFQQDCEAFGLLASERESGGALPQDSFVVHLECLTSGGTPLRCQLRLASWELGPEPGARSVAPPSARELIGGLEPEALRYQALSAHYRSPQTLTRTALQEAERRVEYLYRTRERLDAVAAARLTESAEVAEEIASFGTRLSSALEDDLNTPLALSALAELLKQINDLAERAKGKKAAVGLLAVRTARDALDQCAHFLGLGAADGAPLLQRIRGRRAARMGIDEVELERQISARVAARARRDFARADTIRQAISDLGVELIDGPDGTQWRIP